VGTKKVRYYKNYKIWIKPSKTSSYKKKGRKQEPSQKMISKKIK